MRNRIRSLLALLACVCGFMVTSVQAALPAAFTTALGDIESDLLSAIDAVLPILGGIVVAGLAIWLIPKVVTWLKNSLGRT